MEEENHSEGEPVTDETCDGINPDDGLPCVLGLHKGFHEDDHGEKWLSED